MSDKVLGRGHKISPVARGSKIAYSPCPKIDPDGLSLGILPPNGMLDLCSPVLSSFMFLYQCYLVFNVKLKHNV